MYSEDLEKEILEQSIKDDYDFSIKVIGDKSWNQKA